MMSHEMTMEDYYYDARRKQAAAEEDAQLLREQNGRLALSNDEYRETVAMLTRRLDEAHVLLRQYRREAHPGMDKGGYKL
jgi:hypothetical protein